MSVIVFENLIKLVEVNTNRIRNKESSLCKTADQITNRGSLPCSRKNDDGTFIIKCEECGFHSVENGERLTEQLKKVISKYKMKEVLLGNTF